MRPPFGSAGTLNPEELLFPLCVIFEIFIVLKRLLSARCYATPASKRNVPENQNIEWKESWKDEYLKCICGFANASGGKIIIGKNDSGK